MNWYRIAIPPHGGAGQRKRLIVETLGRMLRMLYDGAVPAGTAVLSRPTGRGGYVLLLSGPVAEIARSEMPSQMLEEVERVPRRRPWTLELGDEALLWSLQVGVARSP